MRERIAELLGLSPVNVAITAHTGEGLTAFGKGEGIFATVIVTAVGANGPEAGA
jgi:2-C-methyl-D-erythritol 2,4-cyclodiphosphate synthase